jgi:hypothetical protein
VFKEKRFQERICVGPIRDKTYERSTSLHGPNAPPLCDAARPLHTRFDNRFGTSIYETIMQPSPLSGERSHASIDCHSNSYKLSLLPLLLTSVKMAVSSRARSQGESPPRWMISAMDENTKTKNTKRKYRTCHEQTLHSNGRGRGTWQHAHGSRQQLHARTAPAGRRNVRQRRRASGEHWHTPISGHVAAGPPPPPAPIPTRAT